MIRGKAGIVSLFTVVGLVATLFGAQLIYHYSESNVVYDVYLESFTQSGDNISFELRIEVKNNNDFDIEICDIQIKLYDPVKTTPFLTINHGGASIKAGESFTETREFNINYNDIPEYDLRVVLSAYLKWGDHEERIDKDFIYPIEF